MKICGVDAIVGSRFFLALDFIEQWKKEIEELISRNIKVVLITDAKPKTLPTENLILYISEESKGNQLRLIVDSTQVLTGQVGDDSANCLFCGQENFVNVFKEAMRNEILLIELKGQKE